MPQTGTKNNGRPTKSYNSKENTGENRLASDKGNLKVRTRTINSRLRLKKPLMQAKDLGKTVPFLSNVRRYGNSPRSTLFIYMRCLGVNPDGYQCTELQICERRSVEKWFCHPHRHESREREPLHASQVWYRRCIVTTSGVTTKQCQNWKPTVRRVKAQRPWSCGTFHQYRVDGGCLARPAWSILTHLDRYQPR